MRCSTRATSALLGKIGDEQVDSAAGRGAQRLRQRFEPGAVAGNEDEIIAAAGKAVGIDGADAGGCTGHDGGAERRGG